MTNISHSPNNKTCFRLKRKTLRTKALRHSMQSSPKFRPENNWASALIGTAIIALTAISSLAAAGWGLGLFNSNSAGGGLIINIINPCLKEGHAKFLISTSINSKRDSPLHRLLREKPNSPGFRGSYDDIIDIEFQLYDESKKYNITEKFLKNCKEPIVIYTNMQVRDHRGRDSKLRLSISPSGKATKVWYNSIFKIDELLQAASTDQIRIRLTPKQALMKEVGASRASFYQTINIAPDTLSSTTLRLINKISIPSRYDDIKTAGSTDTQSITINYQGRDITEDFSYDGPPYSIFLMKDIDQFPGVDLMTSMEVTDSNMKRVEDFLVFAAAAIFGVAVGAFFEILLARAK